MRFPRCTYRYRKIFGALTSPKKDLPGSSTLSSSEHAITTATSQRIGRSWAEMRSRRVLGCTAEYAITQHHYHGRAASLQWRPALAVPRTKLCTPRGPFNCMRPFKTEELSASTGIFTNIDACRHPNKTPHGLLMSANLASDPSTPAVHPPDLLALEPLPPPRGATPRPDASACPLRRGMYLDAPCQSRSSSWRRSNISASDLVGWPA